jgi:hypothetical protein
MTQDEVLALALAKADGSKAVLIAAELGDTRGAAGSSALRSVLDTAGPGSRDLHCAAILALTRRSGPAATSDMLACLAGSDSVVREYGLFCLAAVGDDRGWDQVLAWLVKLLKRTKRSSALPTQAGIGIAYLARHSPPGSDHLVSLVTALRERWVQAPYEPQPWLMAHWPDVAPGGPDPADVAAPNPRWLQSWARHALFEKAISSYDSSTSSAATGGTS